jgi:hypothetical protein
MNQNNVGSANIFEIASSIKKATLTIQMKVIIQYRAGPSGIRQHG